MMFIISPISACLIVLLALSIIIGALDRFTCDFLYIKPIWVRSQPQVILCHFSLSSLLDSDYFKPEKDKSKLSSNSVQILHFCGELSLTFTRLCCVNALILLAVIKKRVDPVADPCDRHCKC